ncbi:MAG: DegV family protein [Actinomycetota bacterium]
MTVRIVTDSACDLPDDVVDSLGITVVPLMIRFGDEELVDREQLSVAEFWRRCGSSDELPSTAAPSPGRFEQAYRSLITDGASGIVSIHLSGELSATLQSARTAAAAIDGEVPIEVVDSRSITVGLGLTVTALAERARDGASLDELTSLADSLIDRTRVLGALDTLEYLKKGGRIGAAQAVLGSLLSIKPLIAIEDGKVEAAGKQRTRGRAVRFVIDRVRDEPAIERLAVMHADCDDVDDVVRQLSELHDGEILVGEIGPVIGAHAGPGTIGVVYHVPS